MDVVLSLLVGLLVVLLITAATGYFVAQEFAYVAVDRSALAAQAAAGDATARRTLTITRRTSFMLSGAQLGITVTALLVGYVAEPLIGQSLGTVLGGVGVPPGVGVAVGTVLALLVSTVIQMLFGELFPKNLAIARPEPVARWLSRSTAVYLAVFGWLIWVFDQASNLLLRLLRIEPVHDVEHSATARDLEHIVQESRETGDLPVELSMLLDRVLDFPRRDVEHAMIPRLRVDAVGPQETLHDLRVRMAAGHSRYPVLDADGDVLGVVHLDDVLETDRAHLTAGDLMRPALVVPTLMTLPAAAHELGTTRNQLACVVDEYGGFAGVLTLEDLAEELVGEITDEHDEEEPPSAEETAEGGWLVDGDAHVDEVERLLGTDLPRGDYETLAGLVIAATGSLPEPGEVVELPLPEDPGELVHGDVVPPRLLRAEVVEVEHRVPSSVRLDLVEPEPVGDDAAGTDDVEGEEDR
ncbi:hemolysin family protein [Aquipuribacter nitratireducens]|uniref:Hemolysin family protein n=1 Tax=Aquipuribacter nitratireducens TaxID=650104 RepID=A0ABW0GLM6_9MICO